MSTVARSGRAAWAAFLAHFGVVLQYRLNIFIWTFTGTLQSVISLSVWQAVTTARGGSISGYDAGAFAGYFCVLLIVRELTMGETRWRLPEHIRSGKLSAQLLRPVHPMVVLWGGGIASHVLAAVMLVPVSLVVAVAFHARIDPSPLQLAIGIGMVPIALVLRFLIDWALANLAFWLTRIEAINGVFWSAMLLLGGTFAPIAALPHWLAAIARWTPFYYALGYPVGLLTGHTPTDDLAHVALVVVGWIVVLTCIAEGTWRAGLRQYTAVGA